MAIYTVRRDYVEVLGTIWMPAAECAMRYPLTSYDVGNMTPEDGTETDITREDVEQWLCTHAGDFQAITDFHSSIGTLDIPWGSEDAECRFWDRMEPQEA